MRHIWRETPGGTVSYCMACNIVVLDPDEAPACVGGIEACRHCESPVACVWQQYQDLDEQEDEGEIIAGCTWAGRCVAQDSDLGCICGGIGGVHGREQRWTQWPHVWPGVAWEGIRAMLARIKEESC